MDTLLRTENGHENQSDLNRPCGTFCYRVHPGSVYNSIRGRQRNVRTSDSDRDLEIGRARPDGTAGIMWHTGTMMC
jgi:hypothetical protein